MDFHGAPLSRTWVKLGATAKTGDTRVTLAEPVTRLAGRRPRHRHRRREPTVTARRPGKDATRCRPRSGSITADRRATSSRSTGRWSTTTCGDGEYRGEVANLCATSSSSRPTPTGVRGHTMYHRGSAGVDQLRRVPPPRQGGRARPLRAALPPVRRHDARQLRHRRVDLGQPQPLAHDPRHQLPRRPRLRRLQERRPRLLPRGRHRGLQRPRPQPRRAGVRAASSCRSRCCRSTTNDGAGFWWANSLNTFTRNVACENDRYGFRFEATPTSRAQARPSASCSPTARRKTVDIRTLPFVRFEDNEAHCDGLYGVNLGDGRRPRRPRRAAPVRRPQPEDLGRRTTPSARRSPSRAGREHAASTRRPTASTTRTTTTTSTATCTSARRTPSRSTAATTT